MKLRLIILFAILLTFVGTARATDVTVAATTIPNFNPSNAGAAVTIANVTVTNGSPTVTCSACLRPTWVGMSGFTITLGSTNYTVSYVTSTSSLTLTANYASTTGTVTATWHPYVEWRFYADRAFQPLGATYIVQPGTPGTGSWYKRYAASILTVSGVKTLYLPEITIDATTDSPGPTNQARYMAAFYRPDNSLIQFYACFEQFRVPPTTPTTWVLLCAYNSPPAIVPPAQEAYTKTQIDALFLKTCSTDQMLYYAATGNVPSCLTVGTGLTISGGALNATSGLGTVTSVGLSLPGIFTVSGSPVTTSGTLAATLVSQSAKAVFAGPVYGVSTTATPTFRALNEDDLPNVRQAINVKTDYQCSGDGTTTTTGNILNGFNTLSGVASLTGWKVGMGIRVAGAGPAGADLVSTVQAIDTTFSTMTIADLASTAVTGGVIYHDDGACLANALTAAAAASGKTVYVPAGTYLVGATLTVPGGVTLDGDGKDKTIIKSYYDGVIIDAVEGSGAYQFKGPVIRNLAIQGDVTKTSQIGLQMTDGSYYFGSEVASVNITDIGQHGLSIGNVYSSTWRDMYISNVDKFPLLYDSANMPGNYFENIYVGNLVAADVNYNAAGFRIKAGDFACKSCNGVNNVIAASKWAVVGKKSGTDGDVANGSASFTCIDCNLETWVANGILAYYGSYLNVLGNTTFAVDVSGSGTGKPIEFEHINNGVDYYAEFIRRGYIDDSVVFQQARATYANSQPIRANGFAPIQIRGRGPAVAGEATLQTFYNSTTGATAYLSRADGNVAKIAVTSSQSFTDPTVRYIEANCAAACTITLPWPGWYRDSQEVLVIKDISGGAATNNVTVSANSGGTVNGSSYTLNKNNGAVVLVVNDTATDWRVVSAYDPAGGGSSSLTATYVGYGSGTNTLTGSSRFTWDNTNYKLSLSNSSTLGLILQAGGGTTAAHPGTGYGLIMPYVGGGQSSGPGIWWTDGNYNALVGMWLNLGLNIQGTGGVANVKIRKATDTSSDGDIVFDLRPNDGRFDMYPYGTSSGNTTQIAFRELAANGTNYVSIKGPNSIASDITWTLPSTDSSGTQCLASNGSGTLSWTACSGGGGTPGGSNKQVQFNNSSSFGGAAGFEYQSGASPNVSITAQASTYVPLYVNGASSQSASLQQWAVNGTVYGEIDSLGNLYLGRGITAASPQTGKILATGGSGTNITGGSLALYGGNNTGSGLGGSIVFYTTLPGSTGSTPGTPTIRYEIDTYGNHFFGDAALANNATNGFVAIPSTPGVPNGTPANSVTGLSEMILDSTNYRLYAWLGGAWRNLSGGSSGITIGTTAITSGTAGRILYETSGNVVGEIAGSSVTAGGQVTLADKLTTTLDNATTNASDVLLDIQHSSSGTPAANFGSEIRFGLESTTTTNQDAGAFGVSWETATHATRKSQAYLKLYAPSFGSQATAYFRPLDAGAGGLMIDAYGALGGGSLWLRSANGGGAQIRVSSNYVTMGSVNSFAFYQSNALSGNPILQINNSKVGIGIGAIDTAPAAMLQVTSSSASLVGLRVDSATNSTVALAQYYLNADDTSTPALHSVFAVNSNGTAAAGFGGQLLFQAESSTTDSQDAAAINWVWTTATHASRTAALTISTVSNAGSLTERWRIAGNASSTAPSVQQTITMPNGGTNAMGAVSENLTLSTSGTTTDTTIDLPANSIILSVTGRITTTITTATDWKLGDATVADRFSDANATLTSGTTVVGINQWKADRTTAGQGAFQQSTAKVRVTTSGTPGAGAIRITVHYISIAAPTS